MTKGIPGVPVGIIVAGGVLVFSGVKNTTLSDTLGQLLKGTKPSSGSANPITSTGAPQGVGGVTPSGNPSGVSAKANQATGRLMAGAYGWGVGQEWTALNNVVMAESSWDNQAQNPGSSAYGIFQFLDTTWASTGYSKTSDPVVQIAAGLAYIKSRYGDPVKAWAYHQANGSY